MRLILVFDMLYRRLVATFHHSFIVRFIVRRFVIPVGAIYIEHCNVSRAGRARKVDGRDGVGPIEPRPCVIRGRYLIHFTIL